MGKRYRIARAWLQGYDFIDKKTGLPVKGATPRALVLECDANGGIIRSDIVKTDKGLSDKVPASGVSCDILYYDRFGRIVGWAE